MTTKEMIEIMQAYERGEQIEWRIKNGNRGWKMKRKPPVWDWNNFEYRVKKQPTYRPYKSADEFFAAQKEHGMYIRLKNNADRYEFPASVDDEKVLLLLPVDINNAYAVCCFCHYNNLLADKVWQDGTPCGVKEE